jgi:hypothetical protein
MYSLKAALEENMTQQFDLEQIRCRLELQIFFPPIPEHDYIMFFKTGSTISFNVCDAEAFASFKRWIAKVETPGGRFCNLCLETVIMAPGTINPACPRCLQGVCPECREKMLQTENGGTCPFCRCEGAFD